jgi:hypothetical protein
MRDFITVHVNISVYVYSELYLNDMSYSTKWDISNIICSTRICHIYIAKERIQVEVLN